MRALFYWMGHINCIADQLCFLSKFVNAVRGPRPKIGPSSTSTRACSTTSGVLLLSNSRSMAFRGGRANSAEKGVFCST